MKSLISNRLNALAPLALVAAIVTGCGQSSTTTAGPTSPQSSSSGQTVQHMIVNGCDTGGTPFGGGEGTVTAPYLICTIAQLNTISSSTVYLADDFTLTTDLDATNETIDMVGAFTGIFDGGGHKISNWTGYGPLFESVSATVRNLSLVNVSLIGSYRSGGIAGLVTSTGQVSNCSVQGSIYAPYMTGGVVGLNQGMVTGCTANVTVTGNDHIGGLVGYNMGTISNSSATATIKEDQVNPPTNASIYGFYFGGLVGYNDGGTITASSAGATITGAASLGGLVGETSSGSIAQCSASGSVTGTGANVGGLVGNNGGATIANTYATTSVQGASAVGGLVGNTTSNISDSFAAGAVSGSATVGGLIGTVTSGTVSSSYWDTQASGTTTSAGGTGETTANMETEATFAGWDFSAIWNVPSGSYPTLK